MEHPIDTGAIYIMHQLNKRSANALYAVIQGLYFCSFALISGYASAYLLNRGYTNGQIGLMLGIGNIGAVSLQLLTASVVSKTGVRLGRVIAGVNAAMVLVSLALLLLPLSGLAFCIAYVLVYTLLSSMQPSVNSLFRGYNEAGIKVDFGAARGVGSAAYSTTSLLTGLLIQRLSPNILPGLYMIPCILLCVAVTVFNAPNVADRPTGSAAPAEKRILMREYPQFYMFFAGVMCLATSYGFTETFLLQIMQRIGGNSASLGIAAFISAMTELPAMMLYRRFADKMGNSKLLIFAGWMWAAKSFIIMLAPNVTVIYLAELLQFVGFAIYVPAGVRFIAHTLPEGEFLKGQALVGSAFTAGYLICSFVGGPMIDLIGLNATLWGVQLFSVGGVVLFTLSMHNSLRRFPSQLAKKAE